MKTYYSILSVYVNPEINERLSVGMLMVSGEDVFFNYSGSKLSVIKKLVSKNTYNAARHYLKLVERSVERKNTTNESQGDLGLQEDIDLNGLFSEHYIDYLSRYSNNLVSFSKPKYLELEANEEIFRKLFIKLIDESAFESREKKESQIETFKKIFLPAVKPFFNIEREIDSSNFKGLYTPVKVDLLGKNENEVFAQTIDFEKRSQSVEFYIGTLLQINKALPNAKQFVIGYEPNKDLTTNFQIWNNIRQSNDFEYVDISEANKIKEYAKMHDVKPLF